MSDAFRRLGSWLLWLALFAPAAAADEPPPAVDWEAEILLYGWLPALDGSVETARGGTEHFEASVSDVLDGLAGAAMGRVNARWRRWVVVVDGLWTALESDDEVERRLVEIDSDAELDLVIAQLVGGYRVHQRPGGLFGTAGPGEKRTFGIDALAGISYVHLSLDLELDRSAIGPLPGVRRHFGQDRDWVAPAVGLRVHNDFTDRLRFETLATAGGFAVGDAPELSWEVTSLLTLRFTEHWQASFGHRVVSAEDDDWDLRLHGVLVGIGYRF